MGLNIQPLADRVLIEPQEAEILADFPGVKGWEGTPPSVAGDIDRRWLDPAGHFSLNLLAPC